MTKLINPDTNRLPSSQLFPFYSDLFNTRTPIPSILNISINTMKMSTCQPNMNSFTGVPAITFRNIKGNLALQAIDSILGYVIGQLINRYSVGLLSQTLD